MDRAPERERRPSLFCFPRCGGLVSGGSSTLLFLVSLPNFALARVKLITLPVRERVEIQLDNASATLVEEERIVPLVREFLERTSSHAA